MRVSGYLLGLFSLGAASAGVIFALEASNTSISACAQNDWAVTLLTSISYFVMAIALGCVAANRIRPSSVSPALEIIALCGIAAASSSAAAIAFVEHFVSALIFIPLVIGLASLGMAMRNGGSKHAL